MSARRIRVLIAMLVVLGGLVGVLLYATGRGALLGTLLGILAFGVLVWVVVTSVAQGNWQALELFNPLECCSFLGIFGITGVITIGGFLLWHSLLLAALAAGSILAMMLLVVSIFAASSKAGSQSS